MLKSGIAVPLTIKLLWPGVVEIPPGMLLKLQIFNIFQIFFQIEDFFHLNGARSALYHGNKRGQFHTSISLMTSNFSIIADIYLGHSL